MKRCGFLILTFLLLTVGSLLAEESLQSGDMESFMGLKWGLNKAAFEKQYKAAYKQKSKEFRRLLELKSLEVFKSPIKLEFTSSNSNGNEKPSKQDLILTSVTINITSSNFEELFDVFKIKYGEPTGYDESIIQNQYGAKLTQKIATWDKENIGRSIIMMKFTSYLDHGLIQLVPYKSEEEKQRERERLMKERQERLKKAASYL
ncbi:MAG: hypothetical protein PVH61_04970 [Candidatus Aminicenantes bacterium]|jgi:hypothetical protein